VDDLVVLDAGPLGLASKPPGKADAARCLSWIGGLLADNYVVAVPEIARYEVRRELVRVGATAGLKRLDRLQASLLFLPMSSEVMDEACSMWAHIRRAGVPTAPDDSLDGDAILAAQVRVAAPDWNRVVIATTNVDHLIRFPGINAMRWWEV
jgi:predicted nucleic acid-binding protein